MLSGCTELPETKLIPSVRLPDSLLLPSNTSPRMFGEFELRCERTSSVALPFDLLRREGVTLTRTLGFFVLSFFPLSKYSISSDVCEAEASWSAAGLPLLLLLLRLRGFVEMVTTLPSSG